MSSSSEERLRIYREAWSSSLALMLSRMSSSEWQAESLGAASNVVPMASLRITVAGGLTGRQWFKFAAADLTALLPLFLGEAVSLGSELDEMQREALEELIRQWSGLAATALKPHFGEVTLQVELEAANDSEGTGMGILRATQADRSVTTLMELSNELQLALQPPETKSEPLPNPLPKETSRPTPSPTGGSNGRIEELLRQGNLDLLMDVELSVMLRFGSRQATLREVLELSTGAVLELDREIQEPVDLVLNGKLIARGEVVVVDGNYGLRVMEVASPRQRISTL